MKWNNLFFLDLVKKKKRYALLVTFFFNHSTMDKYLDDTPSGYSLTYADLPKEVQLHIMGRLSRDDRANFLGVNREMQDTVEGKDYMDIGPMVNCFDGEEGKFVKKEKQKCLRYFQNKPVEAFEDLLNSVDRINEKAEKFGLGYVMHNDLDRVLIPLREDPGVFLMAYASENGGRDDAKRDDAKRASSPRPEILAVVQGKTLTICASYKMDRTRDPDFRDHSNPSGWTLEQAQEDFQNLLEEADKKSRFFAEYSTLPIDFAGKKANILFPLLAYFQWREKTREGRHKDMSISIEARDMVSLAIFLTDFHRLKGMEDLKFSLVTTPSDLWQFQEDSKEMKNGVLTSDFVRRELQRGPYYTLITFLRKDDRWNSVDPSRIEKLSGSGVWILKTAGITTYGSDLYENGGRIYSEDFYLKSPPLSLSSN